MHARAGSRCSSRHWRRLLALVSMQDDNTAQDAIRSNVEASDLWSFFQAKTMRQFVIERDSEMLKVERDSASPEKQATIDDLLKSWAEKSAKYDSDPERRGPQGAVDPG